MSGPLTAEEVQARLEVSAFNRWLGMTVLAAGPEALILSILAQPQMAGGPAGGGLHGGVLAAVIDTASSFAVIARTGRSVATIDLHVDYHRPAVAPRFEVRARVQRCGRSLAVATVEILDAEGRLIASGRAAFVHRDRATAAAS